MATTMSISSGVGFSPQLVSHAPITKHTNVVSAYKSSSTTNTMFNNAGAFAPLKVGTLFSKITMRVSSKQAYICRDCGYIYNDRTPFEKLPDSYYCPVCGAPKKRFRPYENPVDRTANQTSVRKARKEQLKKDEQMGQTLPLAVAVGVVVLVAATYFYLNSQY